jgi:hypothetical protein
MSTPILAHPPFDEEDVRIEAFAAGWDAGAHVAGNPDARYRAPWPGYFRAYDDGFLLALNTPFTFGLADLVGWEEARQAASRRRKLRKLH